MRCPKCGSGDTSMIDAPPLRHQCVCGHRWLESSCVWLRERCDELAEALLQLYEHYDPHLRGDECPVCDKAKATLARYEGSKHE